MTASQTAVVAALAALALAAFIAAGVIREWRRPKSPYEELAEVDVLRAELAQCRDRLRIAGEVEAAAVRRCVGCPLSPHYPEGITRWPSS